MISVTSKYASSSYPLVLMSDVVVWVTGRASSL